MNYQRLHDSIIHRALTRPPQLGLESHHITPKCEGGHNDGPQVHLTTKEHRIVHRLRYKLFGVVGNILAYNLMRYGRKALASNHSMFSSLGGKAHHLQLKIADPIKYSDRQRKAGLAAGMNSKTKQLGFYQLSKDEKKAAQDKGRQTTVEQKLGMFSDQYREQHRKTLFKPVVTPAGTFDSMQDAADHYGVSAGTITYRVNNTNPKWNLWNYMENNNE